MSSFIDNCLLPVVNQPLGIDSPVKKSRNRIEFAPSDGFCNPDAITTMKNIVNNSKKDGSVS